MRIVARGAHLAGAALSALLVGACGSDAPSAGSAEQLRDQVHAVQSRTDRVGPPALAPTRPPEGWTYLSAGGSSSTLTIDFLKRDAGGAPLPAVTICISTTEATTPCQSTEDTGQQGIPHPSRDHAASMIGSAGALADWAGVAWTTDLDALDW